ncbi:MAG: S41 family peptidase, partial [Candidatus Latescibacteria bacterium]|nr:S41 family peptidase [Candidatus Latescibacterota bacterium]
GSVANSSRFFTHERMMTIRRHRSIILILLVPAVVGVLLFGGWAYGQARQVFRKLKVLQTIMVLSRQVYVDEVDANSLLDGAIDGLLDRLDPHSNYITPEETAKLRERMESRFYGVGIQYALVDGTITVISPIDGAPAKKAGMLAGDRIVAVDGVSAQGWRNEEVKEHIRGPDGTTVVLTVVRAGVAEPIKISIVRGKVPVRSVRSAFVTDDHIGYIRATRFARTTGEDVATAWDSLTQIGMRSLVLDLRDNGGGTLGGAVAVCDLFLPEGTVIVSQKGRWAGATQTFYATKEATRALIPIVVLINHGSASASEIVAGAVQDTDRGLVVGRTSFGKGLVQRQFDVSQRVDGAGSLLLTVARYYTPSGRLIQRDYGENKRHYYQQSFEDDPIDSSARERFETLELSRTVFGGGGISPDVRVEGRRWGNLELTLNRRRLFFRFADHLTETGRAPTMTADEYLRSGMVDSSLLGEAYEFATKSGLDIEPQQWQSERDLLATR